MVDRPFFSIVIPTYNRADDLRFALFCILQQTFADYEIIVCDNNSQDDTRSVVMAFHSRKIHYVRNRVNIGDKRNYKKGIQLARGKYIFLHGDDDYIFRSNSLREIHESIYKYMPGFVRINYLCQTPDKKIVFDFVPNRVFSKNEYLAPRSKNADVVNFILNTDAYFITGIIFRNDLPKNIDILFTEPCPWIDILLYCSIKYGAYFMAKQQIIASWSRWRSDVRGNHVLFGVIDGKLQSEKFFQAIKRRVTEEEYDRFLYEQLRKIYVCMFPAIKFFTGSRNLIRVSKRIQLLSPRMARSMVFRIYFLLGLITPRFILGYVREYFFLKFTRLNTIILHEKNLDLLRASFFSTYHDKGRGERYIAGKKLVYKK